MSEVEAAAGRALTAGGGDTARSAGGGGRRASADEATGMRRVATTPPKVAAGPAAGFGRYGTLTRQVGRSAMPGADLRPTVLGRWSGMKAVVVYESFWGNTAAIARAIAEGIGEGAVALSTAEATAEAVAGADLIVAGSPVIAFQLPTDKMRETLRSESNADKPADLSAPSMRSWLDTLPKGRGRSAAFETRMRWSPGGSTGAIAQALEAMGYASVAKPGKFVVKGRYGPLRDGEIERARAWGTELARAAG